MERLAGEDVKRKDWLGRIGWGTIDWGRIGRGRVDLAWDGLRKEWLAGERLVGFAGDASGEE